MAGPRPGVRRPEFGSVSLSICSETLSEPLPSSTSASLGRRGQPAHRSGPPPCWPFWAISLWALGVFLWAEASPHLSGRFLASLFRAFEVLFLCSVSLLALRGLSQSPALSAVQGEGASVLVPCNELRMGGIPPASRGCPALFQKHSHLTFLAPGPPPGKVPPSTTPKGFACALLPSLSDTFLG